MDSKTTTTAQPVQTPSPMPKVGGPIRAELVTALEGILAAFVHVPGDVKGNKVRTVIFKNCVNMRNACTQARAVLDRERVSA